MTLIIFSTTTTHPFAEQLSQQGHTVYEALAISEVLALQDQHSNAAITITAHDDPERAAYTALKLKH